MTPKYEQPALDPAYAGLMAQSKQQNVDAIREREQIDMSSLLARYGANLAMANGSAPSTGAPQARDWGWPAGQRA